MNVFSAYLGKNQHQNRATIWHKISWLLLIAVITFGFVAPQSSTLAATTSQRVTGPAADNKNGNHFGNSVDLQGDTAVIGAFQRRLDIPNYTYNAGAVYVYTKGAGWSDSPPPQMLRPTDILRGDRFGWDVALDGDVLAVSATQADTTNTPTTMTESNLYHGKVYIYRRSGNDWQYSATLMPPQDLLGAYLFGHSIHLDTNGTRLIVGAPGRTNFVSGNPGKGVPGQVFIYNYNGSDWGTPTVLTAEQSAINDRFGSQVTATATTLAIGSVAYNQVDYLYTEVASAGSVDLYTWQNNAWVWQHRLDSADYNTGDPAYTNKDGFGAALLLVDDNHLFVGAPIAPYPSNPSNFTDGSVYAFEKVNGSWQLTQQFWEERSLTNPRKVFGASLAYLDDKLLIGSLTAGVDGQYADYFGRVNIYTQQSGQWTVIDKIGPSPGFFDTTQGFGSDLAVDTATRNIVIGTYGRSAPSGEAYFYDFNTFVAPSPTPTATPSATPTPSATAIPSPSPTASATPTPTAIPLPEIAVSQDGTNITIGTSVDGAAVSVGSTADLEFVVSNTGNANLELSGTPRVVISGTDADEFVVTTQPSPSVAPNSSTSFVIRFAPTSTGTKTATVNIDNNDSDENPFVFTLTSSGISPEIDVKVNGTTVSEYDFGTLTVGNESDAVFEITNSGTAPLQLTDSPIVRITDDSGNQFVVLYQPTTNALEPTESTSFTIRFAPTSVGVKTATVSIANNDSDENPFTFTLAGEGTPIPLPEIEISSSGDNVAAGTSIDLGEFAIGGTSSTEFVIANNGTAALLLTGAPLVQIENDNQNEFAVTTQPSDTIGVGSSSTFVVEFEAAAVGSKTIEIVVPNNDSDEADYRFAITANVIDDTPKNYCDAQQNPIDYTPIVSPTCPGVAPGAKKFKLVDSKCNPIRGAIVTIVRSNGQTVGLGVTDRQGVANFSNNSFSRNKPDHFFILYAGDSFTTPAGSYASGYRMQTRRIEVRFVDSQCQPIKYAWVFLREANGRIRGTKIITNNTGEVSFEMLSDTAVRVVTFFRGKFIWSNLVTGSQRVEISQEDTPATNNTSSQSSSSSSRSRSFHLRTR